MCLAQGPQHSDAGEARTHGPSVSSQALYYWATALASAVQNNLQYYMSLLETLLWDYFYLGQWFRWWLHLALVAIFSGLLPLFAIWLEGYFYEITVNLCKTTTVFCDFWSAFVVNYELFRLLPVGCYFTWASTREKICLRGFANNTGADQPAHSRSLISAFVIRFFESIIC